MTGSSNADHPCWRIAARDPLLPFNIASPTSAVQRLMPFDFDSRTQAFGEFQPDASDG